MEDSRKNEIVMIKKVKDHWAFLEHIEAPMWVDLTLEVNYKGDDISDGDWFNTSHSFHQLSAHELKSKFSHLGEEKVGSRVDLQGPASPEVPSSVSKSRGKHYNSKKWEGCSFEQEVKPKSRSIASRPKGLFSAKLGLTFEHNVRGKTKSMASSANLVRSSSSLDNKTGESTTRSTITSENTPRWHEYKEVTSRHCDRKSRSSSIRTVNLRKSCVTKKITSVQRQQKSMEVSSQPCDQKNKSSSISCVSLRKSCVTSKASKVDIGGDSVQSRGRKSSSGKSSVGSCSNTGYEVKFVARQRREKITDEKDVITKKLAYKNRCNPGNKSKTSAIPVEGAKSGNKSKTSAIPVEGAKSGNKKGSNINFGEPAYHKTTKSMVQYRPPSSRAMLPGKVSNENSCTGVKEKLETSMVNGMKGKGKESASRNVTVNQQCNRKGVPAGGMLKSSRTTKNSRLQKDDKAGLAALTTLGKETFQREAKNSTNLARRIYLR